MPGLAEPRVLAQDAALTLALDVLCSNAPAGIRVPARSRVRWGANRLGQVCPWLRYAGSYSSLTGRIHVNRSLYREIGRGNHELFLGTVLHEVLHSNQTFLQNRIDAWWRSNPRHLALDRFANRYAREVLAPAFRNAAGF